MGLLRYGNLKRSTNGSFRRLTKDLENKHNELLSVLKLDMENIQKNEEKTHERFTKVERQLGKAKEENADQIKELQKTKLKVESDIKSVEQKLNKIDVEIIQLKERTKVHFEDRGEYVDECAQPTFGYSCKICDLKFTNKDIFELHINKLHPNELQCKLCDLKFDKNHLLETHISEVHKKIKKHKCDNCGFAFYSEWRLKKHITMHEDPKIRKCHFYNNNKVCPFETLGCKFLHEKSGKCEFESICNRDKCQYSH